MSFFDIAKPMAERQVPQIRLRPRTKIALDSDWPGVATCDLDVLKKLSDEMPDCNAASVAKAELGGIWIFESDSMEVASRIFAQTNKKLPDTFKVRSSPGKMHVYFRQTPASIAMGNLAQPFVEHADWSARVDRAYAVSAGSVHPKTNEPYEIRSLAPIIEAPNWFIDWCISQKLDKKKAVSEYTTKGNPIPSGFRDDTLTSIAGGLREKGMIYEEILTVLGRINLERCQPPLSDTDVEKISRSVSRYPQGEENIVVVGGKAAGQPSRATVTETETEEAVELTFAPYPKFPEWTLYGTSIYEGLCKPICDANCRYPSFIWLPAMTILLNYLGTKVRIEKKNLHPSLFSVLIGRRGKVMKSSSVEDAIRYLEIAGIVGHGEQSLNNANGRSLVFTPASPEGLGKEMQRTNCKNGILFFDELSTLTNKAGIESSALTSNLLTLYGSGKFQNIVKNPKDSYSLLPGTYCASLIACSTDKNFTLNWSKLAGKSTGLDDRFFFLMQPEVLKPLTPYTHVETHEAAARTRQLIEKALDQKVYRIVDSSPLALFNQENDDSSRAEERIEKFALGLAVDLGLDEIDEEVIERGVALAKYEQAVKKYIQTFEASTREGSHQMEAMHHLRNAGGRMTRRDFDRAMHPERLGSSLWSSVFGGMIKMGWIELKGTGHKGDPEMVVLMRMFEDDD